MYQRQGDHHQAADHLQQALRLCGESHRSCEAFALTHLGLIYGQQGRTDLAIEYHRRAMAIADVIGDRLSRATAMTHLGAVLCRQGSCDAAVEQHQQAVDLFREIGDRAGEAEALNGVGNVWCAIDPDRARVSHTAALTLATAIDERYQQAWAHHGLARTTPAGSADACFHWGSAHDLYAGLGLEIEVGSVLVELGRVSRNGAPPPPAAATEV